LKWKETFSLCKLIGRNRENYASRLIEGMIEARRFDEVATIFCDFLRKPELALEVLMKGGFWNRAILVAREYDLDGTIETLIKPKLEEYATQLIGDLEVANTTFDQQTLRLRQVRIDKTTKQEAIDNGEGHDERLDDIDMMSDTSSMATTRITGASTNRTSHTGMTGMTNRTGRTARQKRKLARKRAAGKDAAFEDEFLIKALKTLVERFTFQMSR
jgi:elongator complex protein 1